MYSTNLLIATAILAQTMSVASIVKNPSVLTTPGSTFDESAYSFWRQHQTVSNSMGRAHRKLEYLRNIKKSVDYKKENFHFVTSEGLTLEFLKPNNGLKHESEETSVFIHVLVGNSPGNMIVQNYQEWILGRLSTVEAINFSDYADIHMLKQDLVAELEAEFEFTEEFKHQCWLKHTSKLSKIKSTVQKTIDTSKSSNCLLFTV